MLTVPELNRKGTKQETLAGPWLSPKNREEEYTLQWNTRSIHQRAYTRLVHELTVLRSLPTCLIIDTRVLMRTLRLHYSRNSTPVRTHARFSRTTVRGESTLSWITEHMSSDRASATTATLIRTPLHGQFGMSAPALTGRLGLTLLTCPSHNTCANRSRRIDWIDPCAHFMPSDL